MAASAQFLDDTKSKETIFVISDSDGEPDSEGRIKTAKNDLKSQFDEFVACSNEILKKIRDEATAGKIKKHLLKVFKAARQDYISSEEFSYTVHQNLTELQKPDVKDHTVFSVVHDVVIHLKNATNKSKKVKTKSETETSNGRVDLNKEAAPNSDITRAEIVQKELPIDNEDVSDDAQTSKGKQADEDETAIDKEDVSDVAQTSKEKQADEDETTIDKEDVTAIDKEDVSDVAQTSKGKQADEGEPSIDKEDVSDAAQTSKGKQADENEPSCSKDNNGGSEADGIDETKKHKIRRMEKLMGRLDREIHRYSEKELSLDEMARDDSSHMIEHKLRSRFVEAWKKWCKLKGYEAKTGRGIEKKIKFEGTRYPEINLKIRKLVKHNKFPDFHDVYAVIQKTNRVKDLGIHKFDLRPLATEVFKDIGEKLSKRRINDDLYNAGYASLIGTPDDPANEDPELRNRLEDNATKGREMMDKVLEKYTHMASELHPPGVEPEFDRTSEPEIDESEDNNEEGDWIEYVSDSNESQSEELSVSPETEATQMETNGIGDSKKHPREEDSLADDSASVKKKIKHETAEEKSPVALNGMPQSRTEVKSTNDSQANPHPSLEIAKVESVKLSISMKLSSVSNQIPSTCKNTQNAAGLQNNISLASRNPQQTQHQPNHIPIIPSKKELGDSMTNLKPLQLIKGGNKLLHGNPSKLVPSSAGSLPIKTLAHRTQINSPISMNSTVPSRRIQLKSLPSTCGVSSTMNKTPSARMQMSKQASPVNVASTTNKPTCMSARKQLGTSTHSFVSTVNKPPSAQMQSGKQTSFLNVASSMKKPMSARKQLGTSTSGVPPTINKPGTKLGIPPVQVPSNNTQINGKVVKVTQIFMPNQRNNGTRVRQDVRNHFRQNAQSKQSNGGQKSYNEDDDDIIILD